MAASTATLLEEHPNRKARRTEVARTRKGEPPVNALDRFMPRAEVLSVTGLSDTTLWREIRAKRFPPGIPLSKNRVGWAELQVRAWIADRLASRPRALGG